MLRCFLLIEHASGIPFSNVYHILQEIYILVEIRFMRAYTLSFGRNTGFTSDIFFMQGNFLVVLNCESVISFYNRIF